MTSALKTNLVNFPELQDLLDYISSHPNYGNLKVRDISSKTSKWVMSPAQMSVLQKEWAFLKSSGGKSPFDINCDKWPDLDLFDKFWSAKDPEDYQMSDEMINSILFQAKNRPLSDKQLDVLKRRWEIESSAEYIEMTEREIDNLNSVLSCLDKLSYVPNAAVSGVPSRISDILRKMKKGKYTSVDDKALLKIVDHYKKKIYSSLFN